MWTGAYRAIGHVVLFGKEGGLRELATLHGDEHIARPGPRACWRGIFLRGAPSPAGGASSQKQKEQAPREALSSLLGARTDERPQPRALREARAARAARAAGAAGKTADTGDSPPLLDQSRKVLW